MHPKQEKAAAEASKKPAKFYAAGAAHTASILVCFVVSLAARVAAEFSCMLATLGRAGRPAVACGRCGIRHGAGRMAQRQLAMPGGDAPWIWGTNEQQGGRRVQQARVEHAAVQPCSMASQLERGG